MNNRKPTVSAVILSYNRPSYLSQAIASLIEQTQVPDELIVIDNLSPKSDEVAKVVQQYSGVKLIQNSDNAGYAAGMNQGINAAAGEYIYLTEDDIVVEKNCVRSLVDYMEEHPHADISAPVMYNRASNTIRCAGGEVHLGGIYRRTTYEELKSHQPYQVSYVDGAGIFARADVLKSSPGFREEYFMYVEAVEFCVRATKAGRTLAVVPDARAFHFEPPKSANDTSEMNYHRYKNLFSLYLLHAPLRCLPEFFTRYVLLAGARALMGRGGNVLTLLKAVFYTVMHAPTLLKERSESANVLKPVTINSDSRAQSATEVV